MDAPSAEGPERPVPLLPVGEAALRLGVAAATLRSWGRRYGLTPQGRSAGGHRRYSPTDMARLHEMQNLVDGGEAPARAAARVLAQVSSEDGAGARGLVGGSAGPVAAESRRRPGRPALTPGGPGGAVLAVPGASPQARGLARAASRLNARAVERVLSDLLIADGVVATWENVLRPVLIAAGERWCRTGTGIDVEHVLSEATVEALRTYRVLRSEVRPGPPVLLACASMDAHVLPLHVLAASLAERGVATQILGARVPAAALAAVAGRVGSPGVVVWRQLRRNRAHELDALRATKPRPLVVVAGGPGWEGCRLPPGTARPTNLHEAVELLSGLGQLAH